MIEMAQGTGVDYGRLRLLTANANATIAATATTAVAIANTASPGGRDDHPSDRPGGLRYLAHDRHDPFDRTRLRPDVREVLAVAEIAEERVDPDEAAVTAAAVGGECQGIAGEAGDHVAGHCTAQPGVDVQNSGVTTNGAAGRRGSSR
jgi:hypothetical protein